MYNFDFKKTLGQNFLKDDNIVNKIVICAFVLSVAVTFWFVGFVSE